MFIFEEMVSKRVKSSTIRKKRKFTGNRWTRLSSKAASTEEETTTPVSPVPESDDYQQLADTSVDVKNNPIEKNTTASSSKIQSIETDTPNKRD